MARRVGRFCSKRKWKLLEGFKQEKDILKKYHVAHTEETGMEK